MSTVPILRASWLAICLLFAGSNAFAQSGAMTGRVRDQTGAALPGVTVDVTPHAAATVATTDASGTYRLEGIPAGTIAVSFRLINFGDQTRRDIVIRADQTVTLDVVLSLSLNADVTVTGKRTFTNLADAERPAEDLVGIAGAASQGAITARQLEARPIMRAGEVLETVPGVIISQHSGEGKANQYYLRGFNLDHGTDFATTLAGMPVNMPTHGHGHGYSDLNFLIPEIVSGVQYAKGPYFAENGDFATAGSANINYVNSLDAPILRMSGGEQGYGRAIAAASPRVGRGRVLAAFELNHNDGPWDRHDAYRKVNGVVRYSQGDAVNGFSITGMGYQGRWNSTDQIPMRAVEQGLIGRFGVLDRSDGGETSRYSGSVEWQRTRGNGVTKVSAYGLAYDLDLFSNFTYFLDDPINGDQFEQADHRFVTGGRVTHRRLGRWGGRAVQNTFGLQVRRDDITNVGLYHTKARQRLDTVREDAVQQTSGALYVQNEVEWSPWLRTILGMRGDVYRFDVDAGDPANGGTRTAGLGSPKASVILGPWRGTELYGNFGTGFHSNDARGATITRDPKTGDPVSPVTPLVRATGAEFGIRSVRIPHLQTSLALWTLDLDSELVFVGDAGTVEAGRPSHRFGIEFANYYSPKPWLTFDADLSLSQGHFTDSDPAGDRIPGAVETVVSAGATVDAWHNIFGSLRLRYFGSRPLIEDDSVRSKATTLVNLEGGYAITPHVKIALDVFNLLNAKDSDIDYFYASRLPGEPLGGLDDIHFHPALPRTARVSLIVGF
jgi:outer membrane receptor protein involved in Fe transport